MSCAQSSGARLVAVMADANPPAEAMDALGGAPLAGWLGAGAAEGARLFRADEPRAREVAGWIGDRLWLRPLPLSCLRPGLPPSHVGGALHELTRFEARGDTFVVAPQDVLVPALFYLQQTGLCRSADAAGGAVVILQHADMAGPTGLEAPLAELERLSLRGVSHLGINLHDHLVNTFGLLQDFGNPQAVCLAGLYHAAYGTEGLAHAVFDPSDRTVLADLIGTGAEDLVYHYCACDRAYSQEASLAGDARRFRDRFTGTRKTLAHETACGIWEMTVANELEIASRDAAFRERYRAEFTRLFTAARLYLSRAAYERFRYVFR